MSDGVPEALSADILEAYTAGLAACDPTDLVKQAVREGHLGPDATTKGWQVVAIGKAAPKMVWGLVEAQLRPTGIGCTLHGVQAPRLDGFRWHAGGHPIPDAGSFAAGEALMDWADGLDPARPVLVLLSGGGSACVEAPAEGHDPDSVVRLNQHLLGAGKPIAEMNRLRAEASRIKGGRLGRLLSKKAADVRCWVVQDTPDWRNVASGPCVVDGIEHHVLADNGALVAAAGLRLGALGYDVFRHPDRVDGDAGEEVERFMAALHGLEGRRVALVGGGEPLVPVPEGAPVGGRAQHCALLGAGWMRDHDSRAVFAALGSDGIDGTTGEAGAWATAEDADDEAAAALDAHRHLAAQGRTVRMGPTGTNVNDLWIGLRGAE